MSIPERSSLPYAGAAGERVHDQSASDQPVFDQPVFDQRGLVPAVVQDAAGGDVLMMAWMDAPAYRATCTTGLATFYSRSRREQWVKGATSGNYLRVREVRLDCDRDTVLVRVDPDGPACHTGARSCFDAGQVVLGPAGDSAAKAEPPAPVLSPGDSVAGRPHE